MNLDPLTIIALMAAVFVIWKLRSVLGTRNGNEPTPPPIEQRPRDMRDVRSAPEGNVVTLPNARNGAARPAPAEQGVDPAVIDRHAKGNADLRQGLIAVAEGDPSFDPDTFLDGARMAYEMIVTAFADGDKATLRNLLSPEVFESFESVIDERKERGETVQASFVGIEQATLTGAEMIADEAHLTVDFVSQMISATVDKAGEVVEGDPQEVAEVTDRWTFARSVRSPDPNWNLVATDA